MHTQMNMPTTMHTPLHDRSTWKTMSVAAVVLLLAACTSPQERARFQQVGIETYPVRIVAVDGAAVADISTPMAPGPRKVTVQMPAAAGFKTGEVRTLDLDVKPCTQYWLVATRDARSASDYELKVDYEKRDQRCVRAAGG